MSIPACILLASLLGLIGQSACSFPRAEDTLELASKSVNFLSKAREDATKRLANDQDYIFLSKYDQKINNQESTKRASGQVNLHQGQTTKVGRADPEVINHELENRIMKKLNTLYNTRDLPLKFSAYKRFDTLVRDVWKQFGKFSVDKSGNTKALSGQEHYGELCKIFNNFEKISELLQDEENHISRNLDSSKELYSVILNLSDIFYEHLDFLAKYKLINMHDLKIFINDENVWMIIYHYLSGKFLQKDDITSIILNHEGLDFGIEEIPFTQDMQHVFKLLDENTLMNLSRIDLAIKIYGIESYAKMFNYSSLDFGKRFSHLTSPESLGLPFSLGLNTKPLAKEIVEQLQQIESGSFPLPNNLKNVHYAKILLGMLNLLKKNSPNDTELGLQNNNFINYHGFKEVEEAIGYFSDALKLVYTNYVNTIQRISKKKTENSSETNDKPASLIYLTKLETKKIGSAHSCKVRDDESGFCAALKRRSKEIFEEIPALMVSGDASIEELEEVKLKMEEILREPVTRHYLDAKSLRVSQNTFRK
ncbi:hypothetical protein PGT21_018092 [Puccinia graminis f. sp. tritici]|uniref:Uncharacterized protein n=1 Tax=Puccinia graminis f. sp. tritici TaxID=56615 RepID=A0A5B0R8Z3_PUCGR|nr:hypothetical protein PGT21_018092 [Puccinia graminis f. sp. tritici]KAA1121798.1 hypothetical protein PGTUg99_030332 [Puccinia graminis f. sp. tritici]